MKAKSKKTTTKKAPAKKAPTVKATAAKAKATAKPAETQKQAPAPASGEQPRFAMIDIESINSSNNVRTETTDISDLVESIKANGIINPITVSYNKPPALPPVAQTGIINPITVSNNENPFMFDVVAGHRRFAAAKLAGLFKIPCHIIDGKSENELNEIAIQENTIRVDMTPYEECIAIKNLVNKNNTPRQIAARFGRTLRWVLVRVKLATAGDKVLEKVKAGSISMANAAKLADLPDKEFADEMRSVYRLDDYTTKFILERHHMDLKKAPFDTCDCSTCAKCSAQQQDLFAEENVNYCLDPKCWAKKCKARANEKKKEFESNGIIATVGDDGTGRTHKIESWEKKKIEQAEQAGIKKRVIIDPKTCRKEEYYDERDLPNFHEETEEECIARIEKERKEAKFGHVKFKLYANNLRESILTVVKKNMADHLLTLVVFSNKNWLDEFAKSKSWVNKDCYAIDPEEIEKPITVTDIADAVTNNVDKILDGIAERSYEALFKMMFKDIDPESLQPSDDEVNAEIDRQQAEESDENSDEENDE